MTTTVVHCMRTRLRESPAREFVMCDRSTKWGNPFRIPQDGSRDEVIAKYEVWIRGRPELIAAAKVELRGKVLGCWCHPLPCHCDVLARIAEEPK